MSSIKPFKGLRPVKQLAHKVASPPYDVLNSEEARKMAEGNPYSFLHINKPEIDLPPDIDIHSEKVYQKGAENLKRFIDQKILIKDDRENFYVYRQIMGDHSQIGIVACASVKEYQQNLIKKHELTRADKEDDRMNHILHLNAQTGPVFLTYKADKNVDALIADISRRTPEYDFTAEDGISHTFWMVDNTDEIKKLQQYFEQIDCLYVADGHHRSAAASRVCDEMSQKNKAHTGNEAYNSFLTVIFPDDQMYIMDYNRVVKDLNGLSKNDFIKGIERNFTVNKITVMPEKPAAKHHFLMYLDKEWYQLVSKTGTINEQDPVERLDVSVLMNKILSPLLGIGDPRTDKRIDFIGGIRGLNELKRRVDSGEMAVAFALFATSIQDLMAIADAGKIMPPKSTWFEPKLRSGLVIHLLD
ncbi:MAG: DUF1015 domain-containing protein [Calditrichaceae bacterium]|nr:DUF1015 domain-containing protein [Calditrichaceae bacterium]MBN2709933.1 DUF1015 domain-containing protein [Calditrichaceae bacterium]RQV92683.1 MAG: DUF1015 domain-containing protein [Calditrichota bacterium]